MHVSKLTELKATLKQQHTIFTKIDKSIFTSVTESNVISKMIAMCSPSWNQQETLREQGSMRPASIPEFDMPGVYSCGNKLLPNVSLHNLYSENSY